MNPFSIAPAPIVVLDLKAGQLVAARRGERANYQPLKQVYRLPDRTPFQWAVASAKRWGLSTFYIADLDAMAARSPDAGFQLSQQLLQAGYSVWLDCGTLPPPAELSQCRGFHRVIPTEGGNRIHENGRAALRPPLESETTVLSLDFHWLAPEQLGWYGSPRPVLDEDVHALLTWATSNRIQRLLVLNLTDVGASQNSMLSFFLQWRERFPDLQWYLGGGIGNAEMIQEMRCQGITNVLVGNAMWRSWESLM